MAALISRFENLTFVYKSLKGIDFHVAVLVSKELPADNSHRPLLVHFHGGGLVNGTNLEPMYLAEWPLELSETKRAIFLSPEYRLMPEANGSDILEDIGDFWTWTKNRLPSVLASRKPGVAVDLARVAVTGESAGGYLAVQSALVFPEAKIRVVMAQYCGLHPDIDVYPFVDADGQAIMYAEEEALVDEYLKQVQRGDVRVATPFPTLIQLSLAHLKTSRRQEIWGPDERLRLNYGLRTAKTIPPIWIAQGKDDHIMPPTATDEMVARIKKARPEVPLLYSVQPGDHGFDKAHKLSDLWLVEAMAFVGKYWP